MLGIHPPEDVPGSCVVSLPGCISGRDPHRRLGSGARGLLLSDAPQGASLSAAPKIHWEKRESRGPSCFVFRRMWRWAGPGWNEAKRLGVAHPSQTLLSYPYHHTFGAHTCSSFIIAQGHLTPNRIPNNLLSRPEETRHNGRSKIFRARRNGWLDGRLETGEEQNSGTKEELETHFKMQVKRKKHKSEKPGRVVVSHSLTPNTRRPRRRQGRKGQKHPETEIAGGK